MTKPRLTQQETKDLYELFERSGRVARELEWMDEGVGFHFHTKEENKKLVEAILRTVGAEYYLVPQDVAEEEGFVGEYGYVIEGGRLLRTKVIEFYWYFVVLLAFYMILTGFRFQIASFFGIGCN